MLLACARSTLCTIRFVSCCRQYTKLNRMRPYAGISLGLGLGLAAQVSSFAFVPLAVRPGTRGVSNVSLTRLNSLPAS